jgi:hypothetical protein
VCVCVCVRACCERRGVINIKFRGTFGESYQTISFGGSCVDIVAHISLFAAFEWSRDFSPLVFVTLWNIFGVQPCFAADCATRADGKGPESTVKNASHLTLDYLDDGVTLIGSLMSDNK